uniref:MI domain-containing protein n=2 Tax=Schizophyllum commune (strain H4-8 / FGSC 9210) TaxID=578458 RepID=D8Q9Y9_SCHCM
MEVCKEKPDRMPPLDAIGLEPMGPADFAMSRGGSHRKPSNAQAPSRTSSMNFGGPGGAFGGKPGGSAFGGMGNFQTPTSKLTSQERFERANAGGSPTMGFSRPSALSRTSSQGGPGSTDNKRTRSQRGNKRGDRQEGSKFNGPPQGHGSGFGQNAQNALNLEPVAPLTRSENRWTPGALAKGAEPDSPEVVDRKVKGLLNKLTMEKFDSLSDQIIAWANKSEKEKDGRTLIQVIRLVFEKATDEAAWSEMYARLCRKMMEQISPKVQDDGIRNAEGKPITGGQLFRKYLLNRCQEDFERGWVNKEATAAAAATKAVEDEAVKSANEKKEGGDNEPDLYSDEYYAAQKAKRQGLGLIRFIGELFKLQMLTERIMHQCVQKLLGNVDNPEEEEIESLCKLLTTVGELLDTPRAHAHMDVYFARMKELTKKPTVSSRMQFMLQDLIELRARNWRARTQAAGPTTIAQIHEIAAKEKAAQEKDAMHRQSTMSRGGSRRGGDRRDSEHVGPDGWTVAGSSAPRPPAKAGDLSKFGNISKATPMTFGPGSVFAGKNANKRDSISRQASTSNMFHALQSEGAEPVTAPKSSRPPSRKPSVDLSAAAGGEALPQRRKLVLQPRTKPLEENKPDASESEDEGSTAAAAAPSDMSEDAAKKKVEEDVKEFFAIRNMEEAENYFTTLPANHHHLLIDKLVTQAMDRKEADVKLVGDLFTHALGKKLVSTEALEEGIAPTMEFIEDIAIDVPKAWDFMATLVKAACFDEETRTRLANKSSNADKMLSLLS